MKKKKDLNQECDYFSASRIDDIVWIELKGNIARHLNYCFLKKRLPPKMPWSLVS